MSKKVKKVLKVIGVLAFMEYTDIAAKGQTLYWMELHHPEAAKDYRINTETNAILRLKAELINKTADFFNWAFLNN